MQDMNEGNYRWSGRSAVMIKSRQSGLPSHAFYPVALPSRAFYPVALKISSSAFSRFLSIT
jgi:hypothetical protein